MRVEFEWEMTDDLARTGNAVVTRHLLRGLSWQSALVWWLVALAVFVLLASRGALSIFVFAAGLACGILFLVLVVALVLPSLHRARLRRYLERLAAWPHRRVKLAVTPDVVELTTPTASGLFELADLQEVLPDREVTVLLFRGGIAVPVPTAIIPAAARPLLRLPGTEGGAS